MSTAQHSHADSVLAALRAATRDAHAELDTKLGISVEALTRERYGVFLRASMAVVAPLEASLVGWLVVPSDGVSRTTALRADLEALGEPEAAVVAIPSIHCLAAAMGAAYVVEGSALGGAVLARTVARALGTDAPRRYLTLRGENTGTRWRELVRSLEQWGAHAPAHLRVVACETARETFAAYSAAFAAAGALA